MSSAEEDNTGKAEFVEFEGKNESAAIALICAAILDGDAAGLQALFEGPFAYLTRNRHPHCMLSLQVDCGHGFSLVTRLPTACRWAIVPRAGPLR